ncbi:MAG TPA: sensor histidine kinase [Flavisolibacter sp.]|nr:sensor histidine kinase [Flavisolibacter sp.]
MLRGAFTLLGGILIPVLSHLVSFHKYTGIELLGIGTYFLISSFCISSGCRWIVRKQRDRFHSVSSPLKIAGLGALCAVYAAFVSLIFSYIWIVQLSHETISTKVITEASITASLFGLLYLQLAEIEFLTRERILDGKIVDELDKERITAELSSLKNELDPHFMFNSLITLSHLIAVDAEKAQVFNSKLAEVYKYILQNKNRDLISLQSEIDFIQDYMFLLRIRHDNKLHLEVSSDSMDSYKSMLLPLSLQTLVENAIKHNQFTEQDPLQIKVHLNGSYIRITNNVKLKPYLANSTNIGLKNLSNRYKLTCNKDIVVERGKHFFSVKLPLITSKS